MVETRTWVETCDTRVTGASYYGAILLLRKTHTADPADHCATGNLTGSDVNFVQEVTFCFLLTTLLLLCLFYQTHAQLAQLLNEKSCLERWRTCERRRFGFRVDTPNISVNMLYKYSRKRRRLWIGVCQPSRRQAQPSDDMSLVTVLRSPCRSTDNSPTDDHQQPAVSEPNLSTSAGHRRSPKNATAIHPRGSPWTVDWSPGDRRDLAASFWRQRFTNIGFVLLFRRAVVWCPASTAAAGVRFQSESVCGCLIQRVNKFYSFSRTWFLDGGAHGHVLSRRENGRPVVYKC